MLTDPALVVVDAQNDFCTPGYAHDPDPVDVAPVLEATERFLDRYRDSGRTPVLVRTLHDEASTVGPWATKYDGRPVPCRPGTTGAEFVPELDVRETDVVVTKRRYDAFFGTPLQAYLEANDVTSILVGGVSTNVCVESTVRSAFDRGYEVTLLSDCTASTEADLRRASLANVAAHFGSVRPSDEVRLDAVEAGSSGRAEQV